MYRFIYGFVILGLSVFAHYCREEIVELGIAEKYSYALPLFLFGVFCLYQGVIIYSKIEVRLPYGLSNKSLSIFGKSVWFSVCFIVCVIFMWSATTYVYS